MKKRKFNKGDMLAIEWWDAFSSNDWICIDQIEEKYVIYSVGIFLYSNKTNMYIAQSLCPKKVDEVSNYIAIPWGMIMDLDVLEKIKKSKVSKLKRKPVRVEMVTKADLKKFKKLGQT